MTTKVRFRQKLMPYVEGDIKYIQDSYAQHLQMQGLVDIMEAPSKNTKNRQMKSTGGNTARQQTKQQAKNQQPTNSEPEQVEGDGRQANGDTGGAESNDETDSAEQGST